MSSFILKLTKYQKIERRSGIADKIMENKKLNKEEIKEEISVPENPDDIVIDFSETKNLDKSEEIEMTDKKADKKVDKKEVKINGNKRPYHKNTQGNNTGKNFSNDIIKAQVYEKNIQEETIFNVEITGAKRDEEYGDIMLFTLNDTKGIISKDEADDDIRWNSLIEFIGRKVPVVIKSYDDKNDRLICSRKDAQKIIKSKIVLILSKDDEITAKIVKLKSFGAYVEIQGVTGILKNENFSDDHISVSDVFKIGDTLPVKLLRVNRNGKIAFKVAEMYKKSSMSELSNFEVDQVVKGPVMSVKDWGFYVRLLPGVDALCPLPREEEIFVGSNAVIKLTQIFDEKKNLRIRGRLIKFLSF